MMEEREGGRERGSNNHREPGKPICVLLMMKSSVAVVCSSALASSLPLVTL